ncbi:hypothetical protein B5807_04076 [Epicoccum nigrum]|uniref:Uncharacterized protein n=1 Tax=Epicoccum nigrum TaxID=105696 RepID=A0A1Y2M4M9_EPING|nr:hypothetical protein B5807_04076 [Epicoccum nigrum]
MTVPTIWSQAVHEKIVEIARNAGLPGNISLVSELEAAALAVLRNRSTDGEPLGCGDCFVVCDAGSATVDLISYEIKAPSPLKLEECTIGERGLCGSNYFDQAFEKYIRTIVGEPQWRRLKSKSKHRMMRGFEGSIKRCYNGNNEHFSVDLQDVEDNSAVGIDREVIALTPAVPKTIFDHVIDKVLRLVDLQVDYIEEHGKTAKM